MPIKNVTSLFRYVGLFSLFLYSTIAVSQDFDHLFSTFEYPDVSRKSFFVSPAVDLFQSSSNSTTNSNTYNIELSIDGNYLKNTYTRDRQINTSLFFNTGFSDRSGNIISSRPENFHGLFNLNNDYRFYDQPKRYLRIQNQFSIGYNPNTINSPNSFFFRSSNEDVAFSISPKISLGLGRREIVSDLWHAMVILEILEKENVLLKELNSEDIEAFATEISEILNTRRTDFRHEIIAEQERLINYFLINGLADLNNPRFYAVLIDAWAYERFTTRLHGIATEFGIGIGLEDQRFSINSDSIYRGLNYIIGVTHFNNKVISKEWQFDQTYDLEMGIRAIQYLQTISYFKNYFFNPEARLNIKYLQSRRTNYTASLIGGMNFYIPFDENSSSNNFNYQVGLNGSANYYFSPQLRLRVSGYISLFGNKILNIQSFSQNIRSNGLYLSVDYFLF